MGYKLFDPKGMQEFWKSWELQVQPVDKKLRRNKLNWLQHVTRMNNRMPKIRLKYRSHEDNLLQKEVLDKAKAGLFRPNLLLLLLIYIPMLSCC